jgi:hypothetical protein
MSNPFQLTFTLKQHTPIIHFQHDQEGATLRATEVKPKLDRFLISRIGEANIKDEWKGAWRDGYKSLNYKINIKPDLSSVDENVTLNFTQDDNRKWKSDNYPMLLANMGGKDKKEDLRQLLLYEKHELTVSVFNYVLKNEIEKWLPCFFAETNFGNRQTKGFGSFTVSGIKKNGNVQSINPPNFSNAFHLEISTINNKKIFESIDYYWKRLKSGINYSDVWGDPTKYKKSELYNFINSLPSPISWEKRWLKEKYYGLPYNSHTNPSTFARALLGLPDKFEFVRLPQKNGTRKKKYHEIEGDYTNDLKWTINVTHPTIDRISSPIIFKPIKGNTKTIVYILFKQIQIPAGSRTTSFIFSPAPTQEIRYTENGRQKIFKLGFTFKINENRQMKATQFVNDLNQLKNNHHINDYNYKKAINYINSAFQHRLSLPDINLNLEDLIQSFHNSIGNQFSAIDFYGNEIAKVKVGKTP